MLLFPRTPTLVWAAAGATFLLLGFHLLAYYLEEFHPTQLVRISGSWAQWTRLTGEDSENPTAAAHADNSEDDDQDRVIADRIDFNAAHREFMEAAARQEMPSKTEHSLAASRERSGWRAAPQTTTSQFEAYSRYAYLTLLSSDQFIGGTLVLIESLLLTATPHDIIVMVLAHISPRVRNLLAAMDIVVVEIDYIDNPYPSLMVATRQRWNFSKLRAWQMTEYEKLVMLDSDMVVLRNMDELFELDVEVAAVLNFDSPFAFSSNTTTVFNSGLMLIRPSMDTFVRMLHSFEFIRPYNGGDQGFLNEFFKDWTELPTTYNANKMIFKYAQEEFPSMEDLKVIHFVRKKPWYDIQQQYENHHTETLFDTPEDYEPLNRYWILTNAFLNLRLTPPVNMTQHLKPHCVPVWRPQKSLNETMEFCVSIWTNFCPFGMSMTGCRNRLVATEGEDLTLATQLSFDRFDRLEELAKEWEGPISAAIWLRKEQWTGAVSKIMTSNLPFARTAIHLVIQNSTDLFPINVLRNVAINNSHTDMVFSLDVDFTPSPYLYRRLANSRRYKSMWELTERRHVFVIAAFEFTRPQPCLILPHLQKLVDAKDVTSIHCFPLPLTHEEMVQHLKEGDVQPFHPQGKGHRATDNVRWMEESRAYYIEWEPWYEPYIVGRRSAIDFPWFDERFYDRSHNKVVGSFELYARGFRFVVIPDGYCIHRWEDPSLATSLRRPTMPGHTSLYESIVARLAEKYPCVSDDSLSCADSAKTPTFRHYGEFQPLVEDGQADDGNTDVVTPTNPGPEQSSENPREESKQEEAAPEPTHDRPKES